MLHVEMSLSDLQYVSASVVISLFYFICKDVHSPQQAKFQKNSPQIDIGMRVYLSVSQN